MQRTQYQNRGFTLIELLISMSLILLLLFLTNILFQGANRVVTTGIQSSKVLAAARTINEQITEDANLMQGPDATEGGYIVIIQRPVASVAMLDPENLSETTQNLRSDQLVFIRSAANLASMTPEDGDIYRSSLMGQAGDFAKIYYGHAQRLQPDGTPLGASASHQLGGSSSGLDRIGSNWILARQPMLFSPSGLNTASDVHAENAYRASAVLNSGYSSPTTNRGITDVTAQSYGPVTQAGPTPPASFLHGLINGGGNTDPAFYYNTSYYDFSAPLYVNPSPDPNSTNFSSWAIAQTHPILTQGCSDFIVDFAADLNGNGLVDTHRPDGTDVDGAIRWYDWQDAPVWTAQTTANSRADVDQPYVNLSSNVKVFVFRADDTEAYDETAGGTQAHSYWPYMIRIRYRLHDTRGRLTSSSGGNPISGRWFERIIDVPRP